MTAPLRPLTPDMFNDPTQERPAWAKPIEVEQAQMPDWAGPDKPLPPQTAKGNPDWVKGKSGNPLGRPKGSRNKLAEDFVHELYDDFLLHGKGAIETTRQKMPHQYLKIIASLMPKELKVDVRKDLTDEQLDRRLRQLASLLEGGSAGTVGGEEAAFGSQSVITIQALPEAGGVPSCGSDEA